MREALHMHVARLAQKRRRDPPTQTEAQGDEDRDVEPERPRQLGESGDCTSFADPRE